jgi:prophage maintenance system killer protein
LLNGFELAASVDDAEQIFLSLAAGSFTRAALHDWIKPRLAPFHF